MTNRHENPYEVAAASIAFVASVTVRKYRASMTGVAHRDGTITTPRPRGPVSFATFAHEVGHHALGHLWDSRPRWVEETEAWRFALDAFERFGLNGYDRAYADACKALAYSYSKAIKRGVKPAWIEERYPAWWRDALAHDHHRRLHDAVAEYEWKVTA